MTTLSRTNRGQLEFQATIIFSQSKFTPAYAISQVLSTLFGMSQICLDKLHGLPTLPVKSVLFLTEDQIPVLRALRQQGCQSAVVILGSTSFDVLLSRYPLLKYGSRSHTVWGYPWQLTELLAKLEALLPITTANLEYLQVELDAAEQHLDQIYETQVLPYLEILQQPCVDMAIILSHFQTLVLDLFAQTPIARHAPLNLKGYGDGNVSGHFETLIRDVKASSDGREQRIQLLRQVLEEWCEQVRDNFETYF